MGQRQVARWWVLGVLVAAWNTPWAARVFLEFPLGRVWAAVSFGLAVVIGVVWIVPGLRRAVFVPDTAGESAGGQVAAAAMGFAAAGALLLWSIRSGRWRYLPNRWTNTRPHWGFRDWIAATSLPSSGLSACGPGR